MNIKKILQIFKDEGVSGIYYRVSIYFYNFKYFIWKLFNIKIIRSRYNILLNSNFSDTTFKFYFTGSYGNFYSDYLKKKKNKFLFIDIGANQGLYTICAAKNKNCIKVYSFEPIKKTFDLLRKNISINKVEKKCKIFQKAISKKTEQFYISYNRTHSGVSTLCKYSKKKKNVSYKKITAISCELLKKIIIEKKIPISIKIDVEGHENTIILGLIKSKIFRNVNEIFFEVDINNTDVVKSKKILSKVGFKKFKKIGKNNKHYDILALK